MTNKNENLQLIFNLTIYSHIYQRSLINIVIITKTNDDDDFIVMLTDNDTS